MQARHHVHVAISFIAVAAILSATYFILRTLSVEGAGRMLEYRAAFISFLIIVLCMETRVRMGFRLPRGRLFATHLIAAVPFLLLLGTLAFIPLASWLSVLCFALFLATLGTGAVLFSRSYAASTRSGPQNLPQ